MIVYDNIDNRGYKSKVHIDSSDIIESDLGKIASIERAVPPLKEIPTPIKRKLTPENSKFIESLGFKVKKQNA